MKFCISKRKVTKRNVGCNNHLLQGNAGKFQKEGKTEGKTNPREARLSLRLK